VPSHVTWVLKASKLCNLRCTYCYEYENLADRSRMAPGSFRQAFRRMAQISAQLEASPKFCWHGGEPLVLPTQYFVEALDAQTQEFATAQSKPMNVVQTNLTMLGSRQLDLLRMFDHVSISLDLFGGLRVNKSGNDSQDTVLRNMAELTREGIDFGAITVLSKHNVDCVDEIFNFFNKSNISFRALPYYRSASDNQTSAHALTSDEILRFYERLMDLWFSHGNGISVLPIEDCVRSAILSIWGGDKTRLNYEKANREYVFVVDTNFDVYAVANTYDPSYCYGNLIRDEPDAILSSSGRSKAISETQARMAAACASCSYFGSCSGWPIGEATPIERAYDQSGKISCAVVKPLIGRARWWLSQSPDLREQFKHLTLPQLSSQYE
jgi:uncharacterized protein